jgi:hypothetical protein
VEQKSYEINFVQVLKSLLIALLDGEPHRHLCRCRARQSFILPRD